MADFPVSIPAPAYPMEEEVLHRNVRSEFESGAELARRTSTVEKLRFFPQWKTLSEADFTTLKNHFSSQGTEAFNWTHPVTLVTYSVRYGEATLRSTHTTTGRRSVKLILNEIL